MLRINKIIVLSKVLILTAFEAFGALGMPNLAIALYLLVHWIHRFRTYSAFAHI